MIKLKDLITEVAWQRSTLDFAAMRKIPISAPIMKKVIGDINVTSFHITDIQNISKIKSLVGKKKSISTFNTYGANASELKHGIGIKTKGGILLSLEGKLMASNAADIMSSPDETGRRWIADYHLTDIFDDVGAGEIGIETELDKNKIWKEKYLMSINVLKIRFLIYFKVLYLIKIWSRWVEPKNFKHLKALKI